MIFKGVKKIMKIELRFLIMIFILISVFLTCTTGQAEDPREVEIITNAIHSIPATVAMAKETITIDEQTEMLTYFASDELEGRYVGDEDHYKASEFIKNEFEEYGLLPANDDSYYQEFEFDYKNETFTTKNVIGYFPGNHPEHKDEYIVVGAHYDHIGYGKYGSRTGEGEIHNGADDNASGTIGILEIADAFSYIKNEINRNIVFIGFSGEELGLHGSIHYVNNPIFPLEDTVFMLNLDMIGWLKEQDFITSFDTTDKTVRIVLKELQENYPFDIKFDKLSYAASDHYPFFSKGIPVSFLHTGLHDVYHTPEDDTELIDFEGLKLVTSYAFETVWIIDNIIEIDSVFYYINK